MTEQKIEKRYTPHPAFPFFTYDPEGDGLVFYKTEADRDAELPSRIREYAADGTWAEEVTLMCCGRVTHMVKETMREERPEGIDDEGIAPDGTYWDPDHDYRVEYGAIPLEQSSGRTE